MRDRRMRTIRAMMTRGDARAMTICLPMPCARDFLCVYSGGDYVLRCARRRRGLMPHAVLQDVCGCGSGAVGGGGGTSLVCV